jgi:hypothetical protein
LVGKPDGKKSLGTTRLTREDNIKMDHKLNSSASGQGAVADSCDDGNESTGSIRGREFLDQLSDC